MTASDGGGKPDRLGPLDEREWTSEQRAAIAAFTEKRGYGPLGPFWVMLRSPEVMLRAQAMGDYLRYRNVLPKAVSEMVILMTARAWTQQFEWQHHARYAREAGLAEAVIEAIADGRRPAAMSDDEACAHAFVTELLDNKRVSDDTYGRAVARWGEQGVVDMTGVVGYYSMLAMMMNVARTPGEAGSADGLVRWPG